MGQSIIKYIILSLLLIPFVGMAHIGGHYHKGSGDILNSWELKDGTLIKGNFYSGTNEYIILEKYDGLLTTLPINILCNQDQKLAQFKVQRIKDLNSYNTYRTPIAEPNIKPSVDFIRILLLALIALTLFLLIKNLSTGLKKRGLQHNYNLVLHSLFVIFLIIACKKNTKVTTQTISNTIPKTSTSFIDSAFAPYKPTVSTNWDNTYFHVAANGFPNHNMMVGITSWQQQVPIPQFYTGSNSWSIPLQPEYATTPLSTQTNLMKGAVAIAVNGIPIFNALNNRGVDSYATGELDNWGGHCGRADDYHYHAAPLHLSANSGLKPIAFALDGFSVYGSNEPDGSTMQALDACHGHIYNSGVYHYHGTTTYPYVVGAMKGKVVLDPTTPAPENQILPQAFATPLRPSTNPLSGAIITDFVSTGPDAYKLTYRIGSQFGYVEYNWDATKKYTYKLTDISGNITTSVYQR